jgi:Flp pilus assembly protein TadG
MFHRLIKIFKKNSGQGIVELALVIPLFLLLAFGILEGGRVLYTHMVVAEAAREGARAVAVSGDRTKAALAVSKFPGTFTTTVTPSPLVFGQVVTVRVSTNVTIVTPLIGAFFATNPFPVSSTANMREENSKPIN